MRNIVRLKLTAIAFALLFTIFGFYGVATRKSTANSSGPPPAHTGAPAFGNIPGEQSCVACHSDFPVNSGGGNISVTGLPANYTPGAQYSVTVTVNQTNAVVFGFQTVALNNQGQTAGTYILPTQNPQVQAVNGIVGTAPNQITRRYVEHTLNGITPTQFNTKSWTFSWQAPASRQGRVAFYASGNGANSDGSTSGDYIYTNSAAICSGTVNANFDTDAKADIAVFRPSNGAWYRLNSSDNTFFGTVFGQAGDKIVPGDFDGDGKNDIAVFRPSNGGWYIIRSSNNGFVGVQFGQNGDIPIVGDFSGDGRSDLAVFRPSNGAWYILNLVNNAFTGQIFGQTGDKPLSGDFDGDGKNDIAVFRPSNGGWYILRSSDNSFFGIQFGVAEDKPVPGDYDGDGRTDVAVFRPSTGGWYLNRSTAGFTGVQFGISTDVPVPTDYDGDCKTDVAVFRNGNWYILNSSNNSFRGVQFGAANDVPIPFAYVAE